MSFDIKRVYIYVCMYECGTKEDVRIDMFILSFIFVLGAQPPFVDLETSLKTAQVLRHLFLN